MLTRLEIRNWQSLRKVDLELGDFTVIVGPSSSGKSALMRACRALASNVRGSGVITRGQKATAITGHTDTHTITLERGENTGTYRLVSPDTAEVAFTKLNGGVPEAITEALRIEPVPTNGTSINFASQFDRPYLLDDSGANVARALGEMTNVTTIFEAVRSANKIRLAAASTLKTRRSDLQSLSDRLKAYAGLADRLTTLKTTEELAAQANERHRKTDQLEKALRTLQLAELTLAKATDLPDVPSAEPLNALLERLKGLKSALDADETATTRLDDANRALTALEREHERMNEQLSVLVGQLALCPTCGQPVESA
jgi:DNA repair exonuclease SbcCD ATPase subunit